MCQSSLINWPRYYSSVRRPRSRARRMARVRLFTPNLERIWLTCSFTVPGATTKAVAISWLEAPPANNCSTSSSRWLSGSSKSCSAEGWSAFPRTGFCSFDVQPGVGGNFDCLFCRHISSFRPLFGENLLIEETFCLLDAACATKMFHQWERCITGFTVTFCCSPEHRCPFGLSLSCDNIRQLFQAEDQRSHVTNGACELQALGCQGSGQGIVTLACRRLREQGV